MYVNVSGNSKGNPAEDGISMQAQAQCESRMAGWESAGN